MGPADAYPFPGIPRVLRFVIALAAVAVVYGADRAFPDLIDDGSQFMLLGLVVMASAWFAGTGPALAAIVAGAVLGAADATTTAGDPRAEHTHLALFIVQGLLLTALVSELRSARLAAEQQAREAQRAHRDVESVSRMKDEFLATISHELRTPLNAVLGWLHLLRTGKFDAPTARRGLDSIERNVRRQAQLTADLLDVSKALTGRLRLEPRPVPVGAGIQEAVDAVRSAAQAKGVELRTQLADESMVVLADPGRLRQIAWHLLANAVKFTPRGGVAGIHVQPAPDQVILTVYDSGPGIAPQFLPRIFDHFTQEDPSPTRTAGGLGVGLSLVRDLVELHGGEIHARNREDRSGAVFTVKFPRQRPAEAPAGPAPAAALCTAPLDGLRVLVLDEDPEGRELLRLVLQERGAAVRTVGSVADALEALEGWRPDALVTDSPSPEHDTYVVVGKVQWLEADRGGRIPAAALTAYGRTDARVRQMLEDVQRDLPKPVEPAVLASEIARLTGRERRRVARSS